MTGRVAALTRAASVTVRGDRRKQLWFNQNAASSPVVQAPDAHGNTARPGR